MLVLAVDDNQETLYAIEAILSEQGYEVHTANTGKQALSMLRAKTYDLAILDVVMPELDGLDVTMAVRADPKLNCLPVVLLTSKGETQDISRGFAAGASDYIIKPFRKEELLARINAAIETRKRYAERQEADEPKPDESTARPVWSIVGQSPAIRDVLSMIDKVKDASVPVLITGESGTGKELVAAAIHYRGLRRDKNLIIQNCSAFNENLLESELFGHVKGAFTGALRDKQGLFELADGGTFFLDELGEMSPQLQARLLRVLEDGVFTPIGGTKSKHAHVRILAATNRDLKAMVEKGAFREDLYYRLNVVNIKLPSLRERRQDIEPLCQCFLEMVARRDGAALKRMKPDVVSALSSYDWPGNIRELKNEIERLNLLAGQDLDIEIEHLSSHISSPASSSNSSGSDSSDTTLRAAVEKVERQMLLDALSRLKWNKSEAARVLGISRSSLIEKVKLYGLEGE